MILTDAQRATIKGAIVGDANIAADWNAGNDGAVADYMNGASTPAVAAWLSNASAAVLFAAMNVAQFDGITAGKRDAWRLMLDFAPVDFTQQKMRSAVSDVWSTLTQAQRNTILAALTRTATRAEAAIGGPDRLEGGVTAKALAVEGFLLPSDIPAIRGA